MDSLKRGEQIGLKNIFNHYYKYLWVTASNYVVDQNVAKDITQDVFYELWKKRESINVQTSLKAYLRRAVVNRSLNKIKSDKKYSFGDEGMDEGQADTSSDLQGKIEASELQQVINSAIESLPEKCRMVFSLSRFESLSHQEISEQLGISKKTIENQMTKALKIIRQAVRKYGISPVLLLICYLFGMG